MPEVHRCDLLSGAQHERDAKKADRQNEGPGPLDFPCSVLAEAKRDTRRQAERRADTENG